MISGKTKIVLTVTSLLFSIPSSCVFANNHKDLEFLFKMSLEELLEIQVTASNLVSTSLNLSPSAITIISHEQIERTPARNLMDLFETYVPGLLMISNFTSGPRLRMRGLGERHYHTLLLINGKPINQKALQGSMVELRNWDMDDIERVEVVRGPGSVTHGPGAISGVINILTKRNDEQDGFTVALAYNQAYESNGAKLSYSKKMAESSVYFHASVTDTNGAEGYNSFQTHRSGEIGYRNTDAFSGNEANPVQALYGDFDSQPQTKLYLDMNLSKDWRIWFRYNNSGQTDAQGQREIQGRLQDWRIFQNRYYIASVEHQTELSDSLKLKSILSYDSEDYYETRARQSQLDNTHELNRRYAFSEDEIFYRTSLDYGPNDDFSLAVAFEFSHDSLGAPWGDPDGSFVARAGDQAFISQDSVYRGNGSGGTIPDNDVAQFTDGWSADTYSLAVETKYQLTPKLQSIISARQDKNDFTDWMFSPRVAIVYQANQKNIFKASWQKSLRANTMMELYWLDINQMKAPPEHSSTYELSFSRMHSDKFHFSATAYFNDSEIFSWTGSNLNLVGNLKGYGIEPEITYRSQNFSWGLNHSWYEMEDWNFRLKQEDGSISQDVSFSDILLDRNIVTLSSSGDSVNYWAEQQTKMWLDYQINDDWDLHLDARIVWEYPYGKDLLDMYHNAYAEVNTANLSDGDLTEYSENLQRLTNFEMILEEKGAYQKDIRLNASLSWRIPWLQDAKLLIFGQNLINFTNNKRYKPHFFSRELPIISWVEEPKAIGLKYIQRF